MQTMNLSNKKVLLLAPPFYGYEKEIVDKLEGFGAEVKYIGGHPSESYITMMGIAKKIGIGRNWFIKHFEKKVLLDIGSSKFDYVLVINSPYLTSRFTKLLRKKHLESPESKMVLYYWDSLRNMDDDRNRWDDFNTIYVFDDSDYQAYKERVKFLPLFYCDKYWNKKQGQAEYDVMIIGSFRLNRYNFVKDLEANNPDVKVGYYLYHSKWGIMFHKTFRSKYNHVKYEDLRFKKLSFDDVVDLYEKSKAVVDIPMPGQRGLTIRTLETLAMHKKLITTNEYIKIYDFYNTDDIFVLPTNNYVLPAKEWFNTSFSVDDKTIVKYSIGEWLFKLLENGESKS